MKRWHFGLLCFLCVGLAVSLSVTYSQLQTYRFILNDVWDNVNHKMMTTSWGGNPAAAQGQLTTETVIFNDIWDSANHMIKTSGGGGGGGGDFSTNTTTTTNNEAVIYSGSGGKTGKNSGVILTPPASGVFTLTGLTGKLLTITNSVELHGTDSSQIDFRNGGSIGYLASQNDWTGRQNATGASSTAPFKTGTSDPGTCTVGDVLFRTDLAAGSNIKLCTATNTWTQVSGGGGGVSSLTGTANQISVSASTGAITVSIPTNPTLPGTTTGTFSGSFNGLFSGPLSGNASTATALSNNPADCALHNFATTIAANGDLSCAQPAIADLSDGSTICTTSGVCSGYQGTITASDGVSLSSGTLTTNSQSKNFLKDGGTTDLTCGSSNQGKAQVMDDGSIQYCDGATTSVLRKGILFQNGFAFNIVASTCEGDGNGGKITVVDNAGTPTLQCAADTGGSGGSGLADPGSNGILSRTAVNTTTARTITGTSNQITVTNGNGVSGNPTLATPQDIATSSAVRFGQLGLNENSPSNAGQLFATGGANNITLFRLKRNTDTSPTGNFEDFQNAAGTGLWTVDITGSLSAGTIPAARISGAVATATALAANGSNCSAGQFAQGVDASGAAEGCTALPTTISGTSNQITASASTGAITLSTPQDIATTSDVRFKDLGLNVASPTSGGQISSTLGANNITGILVKRNTDTSPTGNFLDLQNAAGTSLWRIDITGSLAVGTIPGANVSGNITGNAGTATALAANGSNCSSGNAPLGVDASGAAEGCFAVATIASTNTFTGRQDASGAASTSPLKVGTSLPGTCIVGDLYFKSDATAGQNIYECAATNTWTQQLNSGGGSPGGSAGQAQWNNTTLAGSSGLTLDASSIKTKLDKVTNVTGNTTLGTHNIVTCDSTSGNVTNTLPAANTTTTGHYTIVKTVSANSCILARAGSDTINGSSASITLTRQWDRIDVDLVNNGNPGNWSAVTSKAQMGYVQLPISAVKLPTSNAAVIDNSENNTRLLFDASTEWCAYWQFHMNPDYGSSPQIVLDYSMTSATTGGVVPGVSVMAVTSGDAADINTDSYDTENVCSTSTVPGTAGFLKTITCSLSTVDSIAADDYAKVKVCRKVANAGDTATGNMEIVGAQLQYLKQ